MPLNKSGPVFKKCWAPEFAVEKNADMLTGYELKFNLILSNFIWTDV